MSFLNDHLFIPRKDDIMGLSTGESDRALRTNWLTIERFLNQGLWSAAMAQSTAQPVGASNSGVPELLTHFTSLWTAKTSAVDTTNSRFALPGTGIYQANLELDMLWTSTTPTADGVLAEIKASSSAATPFTSFDQVATPFPFTGTAHFQMNLTFKCVLTPCYIQGLATIFTPSTVAPVNATAQSNVFSVVRIGSIPSPVQ